MFIKLAAIHGLSSIFTTLVYVVEYLVSGSVDFLIYVATMIMVTLVASLFLIWKDGV